MHQTISLRMKINLMNSIELTSYALSIAISHAYLIEYQWKGVIRGVQYLHEYHPGIVHGDLKPANVLIDNSGNPKICDFGLVRLFMESGQSGFTTTSDHTGTVRYLSPELVTGELTSMASDIYALGCIGLEFVFSILPYHRRQNSLPVNILLDIRDGKPPAERPEDLDGYLENKWEMIENCLHRDPIRRPSASGLLSMEYSKQATESSEVSIPVPSSVINDRGWEEVDHHASDPVFRSLLPQQLIPRPSPQLPSGSLISTPHGYNPYPDQNGMYGYPQPYYPSGYLQQIQIGQQMQPPMQQQLPPSLTCIAPGCTKQRWQDPQGNYSQFCGKRCRNANPHLATGNAAPAGVAGTSNAVIVPGAAPAGAVGTRAGPGGSNANANAAFNNALAAALIAAVVQPNLGAKRCVICKVSPYDATRKSLFCGEACTQRSQEMAPGIIEIPASHPKFTDIANQFQTAWFHTKPAFKPAKYIYFILIRAPSEASYAAYRAKVEQEGNFLQKGRAEGNENRRFYGTNRQCTLGDPRETQLCSNYACGLCGIIRTSFDFKHYKGKFRWGRFGRGLHTSTTSSSSEPYTINRTLSPYKAMLMTKVVAGRGYKMTQDDTTRIAPPVGYHSVLGGPYIGGLHGYDELVVYDSDAIRPAYLIVY
ncbi:hypothetical protein FRB91_003620 [Serendipita sp. 411]|nr:hypothetical protein FRC16_000281 [Serendipita sp. 398]KAG8843053.1 hypothetical protein FRB91_003620 [Serendipita sp. 411]